MCPSFIHLTNDTTADHYTSNDSDYCCLLAELLLPCQERAGVVMQSFPDGHSDEQSPLTAAAVTGGAILANRLAKAAMSEGMADANNHSTPRLEALYRRWARSGAGLLLSGNIQVDRWHLERPGNIVIHDDSGQAQLAQTRCSSERSDGAHFWAQLSHTGRRCKAGSTRPRWHHLLWISM